LLKRKEEKEQIEQEEARRHAERQEKYRWGKCGNGQPIDVLALRAFSEMGFEKILVAEALKQTNNDKDRALALITQSPELLRANLPFQYRTPAPPEVPSEENIAQVVSMGFSHANATEALRVHNGNTAKAIEDLLKNSNGVVGGGDGNVSMTNSSDSNYLTKSGDNNSEDALYGPTPSPVLPPLDPVAEESRLKAVEEARRRQQIEGDLLDAVEEVDQDEYFDVDVEELNAVVQEYRSHLAVAH